jgi:hypothetical protein
MDAELGHEFAFLTVQDYCTGTLVTVDDYSVGCCQDAVFFSFLQEDFPLKWALAIARRGVGTAME